LFSRFKEKLSGFKEALSSKIAEKVSLAEKLAGKNDDNAPPEADKSAAQEKSSASSATSSSTRSTGTPSAKPALPAEKAATESKPKSRFSFLEKAKSLIFEQEVILEEKDLEEPMWALEMALMESQSCAITYPFASHPIHKGSVNLMKVDYPKATE